MERPAPGVRIAGRFVFGEALGEGGMGVVYRGRQELLDRSVAIKVMHPGASDAGLLGRFISEAKAVAALPHPNIVSVLDVGHDPKVGVYIVLELLEGESLADRIARQHTLPPRVAYELLAPVMDALGAAHARGIVHRDVKPSNVFLSRDLRGELVPKLLDFGIARLPTPGQPRRTASGEILGTPAYMSPEQCRGAREATAASDVWAMGVVLYQCVSGALPFVASSPTEMIVAICSRAPAPVPASVPSAVASVITRALMAEPSQRWESMRAFSDALASAVAVPVAHARATPTPGLPSSVDPVSTSKPRPAPRPVFHYAVAAALTIGLLSVISLALLGTGAVYEWRRHVTPHAPRTEVAAERGPWPDTSNRWWEGTWGYQGLPPRYDLVLHAHREGTQVDGVIEFLRRTDDYDPYQAAVSGSYDASSGAMTLEGDDSYRLQLAADGTLTGTTLADGEWHGAFIAHPRGRTPPPLLPAAATPPNTAVCATSGLCSQRIGLAHDGAANPSARSRVELERTVWTSEGTLLESSFTGPSPIEVDLASAPAWLVEGARSMRVGDRWRFWIPPTLASAWSDHGAVVADVELVSILP